MIKLEDVKKIRKRLGITQSQLANLSNVSQSLIAKIEAGLIDPTYSNAVKILDALNNANKQANIKAKDIMKNDVISVERKDTIKDAIKKMKKHKISQMPVIDNNKAVGILSESIILDNMLNKDVNVVEDVMNDSPPVVSIDSGKDVLVSLLKFYPMVLISSHGKIKGVVTKSDLLEKIYK